jgi:DNA-binding transcriptional regulator YiaG/SOS-response transcriptional repressor LexA
MARKQEENLEFFNGITRKQAGEALAELRLADRRYGPPMTQAQLAELVGVNGPYVSDWERGQRDFRTSPRYIAAITREFSLDRKQALERFGIADLWDSPPANSATQVIPAPKVLFAGTVQAGGAHFGDDQANTKKTLIRCPLKIVDKYPNEWLYVLEVTGSSMTCSEIRAGKAEHPIWPGDYVLMLSTIRSGRAPRINQIVSAWLPDLGPHGTGVLKRMGKVKDEFVLTSYSDDGPRYPAQQYPNMQIQGIFLGKWSQYEVK